MKAPMALSGPNTWRRKIPARKKYGAFQLLNFFRDPETGLLDARSIRPPMESARRPSDDPVVFYFHEGFPPRFKPMFEEIKHQTNAVMASAGASLRFDFFSWNVDGMGVILGDIGSFVVWHQDIDTTEGSWGTARHQLTLSPEKSFLRISTSIISGWIGIASLSKTI